MRDHLEDTLLEERIRQLAVEQMSQQVPSIILTRLANGNIEVNVVRDMTQFGRPPAAIVDSTTKEFVRQRQN
jgi:hypothetical protein